MPRPVRSLDLGSIASIWRGGTESTPRGTCALAAAAKSGALAHVQHLRLASWPGAAALVAHTPWLVTLDLSQTGLKELPASLPASLRALTVSYNVAMAWAPGVELPPALEELSGCGCLQIAPLPPLPGTLRVLRLDSARGRRRPGGEQAPLLPEALPDGLEELSVRGCRLHALPAALPATLRKLYAQYNRLSQLPLPLPAALRELHVGQNPTLAIAAGDLPRGLEVFQAPGVRSLRADDGALPPALIWLDLTSCRLDRVPPLPPTLQVLRLGSNWQLRFAPQPLPPSLVDVQLDRCGLEALPEGLLRGLSALRRLNVAHNDPQLLEDAGGGELAAAAPEMRSLQELIVSSGTAYEGLRGLLPEGCEIKPVK